jgi:nucleotide-binding universal stress UspA family protein
MSEVRALSSIPTKILLPLDFSPSSIAALEMATDLALHFHAELFLVNVVPMLTTEVGDYAIPYTDLSETLQTGAKNRMAKIHAVLTAKGVVSNSSVEVGNDVSGNIMEVLEREHADLVVISTHGISGWHPLIFGSIAEKVVKLVQCPLLLLRSPKPESELKTPSTRSMEWW